MIEIALEILPYPGEARLQALELGAGSGYFTARFIEKFPNAGIVAVDGAESMVKLAVERLGSLARRVEFKVCDFRELGCFVNPNETYDLVYSSYALHHLNRGDKLNVIKTSFSALRAGGWFLNADLIDTEHPEFEQRIQEIRVRGIVERAKQKDARFIDAHSTRKFLDALQANEGDQPQTLSADLSILKAAGFEKRAVFWLEYREAVTAGIKSIQTNRGGMHS